MITKGKLMGSDGIALWRVISEDSDLWEFRVRDDHDVRHIFRITETSGHFVDSIRAGVPGDVVEILHDEDGTVQRIGYYTAGAAGPTMERAS